MFSYLRPFPRSKMSRWLKMLLTTASALFCLFVCSQSFPLVVTHKAVACSRTRIKTVRHLARGFGETPEVPKPKKSGDGPKKAKPLMPLASAASKLLPKEGSDGTVQFDNPAVGDFQVFDSLVKYPSSFDLKIIGTRDDTFISDIRQAVASCLTKGDEDVLACTSRDKGRYTSITLKVYVENSAQLYKAELEHF